MRPLPALRAGTDVVCRWYAEPPPRAFPAGTDGDGGFQGANIPLHGESVARLVEKHVDGEA